MNISSSLQIRSDFKSSEIFITISGKAPVSLPRLFGLLKGFLDFEGISWEGLQIVGCKSTGGCSFCLPIHPPGDEENHNPIRCFCQEKRGDAKITQFFPIFEIGYVAMENYIAKSYQQWISFQICENYRQNAMELRAFVTTCGENAQQVTCPCPNPNCSGGLDFIISNVCEHY